MKKVFSFLLIITVFSSVFNIASANEDKYNNAVEILEATGMFDNLENIPSREDYFTRAEFIAVITKVLNIEINVSKDYPFSDVTEKTKYAEYINRAYDYGIIHGDGAAFRPNDAIAYSEAVRVLVDCVGAGVFAKEAGMQGYMQVASNIDITENVHGKSEDKLTFEKVSMLILNTLNTETYERDYKGDITLSGMMLFEKKHDIYSDKGVMTENTYTSFSSEDGNGIGTVKIGDFTGYMYKSMIPEKYLGYYVEYYYNQETENILYVNPIEKKNDVVTVIAEDIIDFASGKLQYIKKGTNKSDSCMIAPDTVVIVNGKNKPDFEKSDFLIDEGYINLIDNNNDGDVDVVAVFSYTIYFVGTKDVKEKIIVDLYDTNKKLYLSDEDEDKSVIITDEDSRNVPFEEIQKYDVLTVVKSEDEKYIRIIVSKNSTEDVITGITREDNRVYANLSEGKKVMLSGNVKDKANTIPVGKELILYYGMDSKLVGYSTKGNVMEYGLFIKAMVDDDENILVKIMTVRGEFIVYKTNDKLKVDGIKVNNDISNLPAKVQVIVYELDGLGDVRNIDTEIKNTSEREGSLHSMFGNEYQTESYYTASNSFCFKGKLWLSADTVIFMGPEDSMGTSNEDYQVISMKNLKPTSHKWKAYNKNPDSIIPEAVYVNETSIGITDLGTGSSSGVISHIGTYLNNDDEAVLGFTIETSKSGTARYNVVNEDLVLDKASRLEIGDTVLFSLNGKDEIINIDYIYNIKGQTSSAEDITKLLSNSQSYFPSLWEAYIGWIYTIEDKYLGITKNRPVLKESPSDLRLFKDHNNSGVATNGIYIVDTEAKATNRVTKATMDDLRDYIHFGEADRIVLFGGNMGYSMVVIYR